MSTKYIVLESLDYRCDVNYLVNILTGFENQFIGHKFTGNRYKIAPSLIQ